MFFAFWMHVLRCYKKKQPDICRKEVLEDVVVSFTTTPKRISKIWPTINSILYQSKLPSKIILWLPKKYMRFPRLSITEIPDYLKNHPLIQVCFIDKDWGPASKLLPCLDQFENNPDIKIIIIDDDRIYPQTLIADLVRYSTQYPQAGITIAATKMVGCERQEYTHSTTLKKIDVMLGYQGFLVKPRFFTSDIFEYPDSCPEAFFEDDVWVSGHLKKNNVACLMIPSSPGTQNILTGNTLSHGLCKYENKDKSNFIKTWAYFSEGLE